MHLMMVFFVFTMKRMLKKGVAEGRWSEKFVSR